mgnify:CR=1 FL=1
MEDLLFLPPELAKEDARLRQAEYCKEQALHARGLLNDIFRDESPKKCIYSDGDLYAFVYYEGREAKQYGLWMKPADEHNRDDWCEVSDLTGVTVYTYQMLKEIAVDIGWIDEDSKWLI